MPVSNQPGTQHEHDAYTGPRKLVRPQLPPMDRRRTDRIHSEDPLSHATISDQHGVPESSHAEVFYFQKQMQQQTEMTVILEDGEQLCGIIQWYDKCVIKMKVGRQRMMIYKSCIKYMYKHSEGLPTQTIMK